MAPYAQGHRDREAERPRAPTGQKEERLRGVKTKGQRGSRGIEAELHRYRDAKGPERVRDIEVEGQGGQAAYDLREREVQGQRG